MRSDVRDRRLETRGRRHEDWIPGRELEETLYPQRKALADLMRSEALSQGDIARALKQVTEVSAQLLRVERASVWRIDDDGNGMECIDMYDAEADKHDFGLRLSREMAPNYFKALKSERSIAAHDCLSDPRTVEFAESYLRPLGITAMLDAPVFVRGNMVAVVCHEHVGAARRWQFWEELLSGTFADFVALVLEAEGRFRADSALKRHHAELERTIVERTAELKASEASLRGLLDGSPVPLVLSDAETHKVVFANHRAFDLFELPVGGDGILGKLDAAQFWVDEEDRQRFLNDLRTQGRVDGMEVRLRTAKGRVFWARMHGEGMMYKGRLTLLGGMYDITEQKLVEERLRELATRDSLTSAYNRRHFLELGQTELRRAHRYDRPLTIAMIDADHFKRINDEYGHQVGDDVLRLITQVCRRTLRENDHLGRYGGEEFVMLLPETDLDAARGVLERVRQAIADERIVIARGGDDDENHTISITVSIGLSTRKPNDTLESVLLRADQACYDAKHAGRNRVEVR